MLRKVLLACIAQAFLFCSAAVAATVTSSWGGSTVYLLNPSYQATYLAAEAGDCAPVCATFTFFNSSFEESSYCRRREAMAHSRSMMKAWFWGSIM